MPNIGRPSQDCHLCRQRRVKCDLARPGCQRCAKYGVDCPGYREQHELVFRNANPLAVRKRKKRTAAKGTGQQGTRPSSKPKDSSTGTGTSGESSAPRFQNSSGATFAVFDWTTTKPASTLAPSSPSSCSTCSSSSSSSSSSCDDTSSSPTIHPLPRPLMEHWTIHSVPILLNVYSSLKFLHNLYRTNPCDGPLIWAAHLFSRTYVTNVRHPVHVCRESTAETQRELGTYMGRTLSAVNAALKEPGGAFRDDVLATVWILVNYELLVGSMGRVELSSPWHLHTRGLYSILQTRGVDQLKTEEGRVAFWPCFNIVQIQALASDTECPPESDTWMSVIKNRLQDGEGPRLYTCVYLTKCTHILATVRGVLLQRDFAAAEQQYESLTQQLEAAEAEIDPYVTGDVDFGDELHVYLRNLYFSASIKAYGYMLCLTNFLTHDAHCKLSAARLRTQRTTCLRQIRAAAQQIVDCVLTELSTLRAANDNSPRILFDALKMVWPLTAVCASTTTLAEQRARAYAALLFIGRDVGVRQALHVSVERPTLPAEARLPPRLEAGEDATPAFE